MLDAKLHGGHSRSEVELVQGVIVVALFQKRGIGRFGEIGLVVEQVEDANRFPGNEPNDGLVIRVADGLPLDPLFGVFLLLQLENVLVKVELQVLVGVIDAQLLKAVFLYFNPIDFNDYSNHMGMYQRQERESYWEVFEAKDVENVDGDGPFSLVDDRVDSIHQPAKQGAVSNSCKWSLLQ